MYERSLANTILATLTVTLKKPEFLALALVP